MESADEDIESDEDIGAGDGAGDGAGVLTRKGVGVCIDDALEREGEFGIGDSIRNN
jgi:hypothetical protein